MHLLVHNPKPSKKKPRWRSTQKTTTTKIVRERSNPPAKKTRARAKSAATVETMARTAKQKAATKKMITANRSRSKGKRPSSHNPGKKKGKRRSCANPSHAKTTHKKRRSRRNPDMSFINSLLLNGATGVATFVGLNVVSAVASDKDDTRKMVRRIGSAVVGVGAGAGAYKKVPGMTGVFLASLLAGFGVELTLYSQKKALELKASLTKKDDAQKGTAGVLQDGRFPSARPQMGGVEQNGRYLGPSIPSQRADAPWNRRSVRRAA